MSRASKKDDAIESLGRRGTVKVPPAVRDILLKLQVSDIEVLAAYVEDCRDRGRQDGYDEGALHEAECQHARTQEDRY